MSVSVAYTSKATVTETLENNTGSFAASSDGKVTHNDHDLTATYSAATTPPVTKIAAFTTTLTAGTASIDMTSMTGTNGATVDASGLKLQVAKFSAPSTNANTFTVAVGTTNGYEFNGASFNIALSPGAEALFMANDAAPDVAAGAKTFDLSGTAAQTLDCVLVFG